MLGLVQVASQEWMASVIWPELVEKILIRRVLSPSIGRVCYVFVCFSTALQVQSCSSLA